MVDEEKYTFTATTKKTLFIVALVGIALFAIGVFIAMQSGHGDAEGHAMASVEYMAADADHGAHGDHPVWLKRIYASLWQNNMFFMGLGIIGLFFVAVQYASQAGWSATIERIPLAMGSWIPVAGVLTLALWFIVKHDVFHWTHASLYVEGPGYDAIIAGKQAYFFWPFEAGGFPIFYVARLAAFCLLWYMFFRWIKAQIQAEDEMGGETYWYRSRALSAVFLVVFAVTSSIAAWDWVMSIDTHWFSTMMGWYVFASWWVSGLACMTLIISLLKDRGYLKAVRADHLHDLGKFVFAFSIFWTYIWFSQFLLIYYANIPEESVYFITRKQYAPYNWVFYVNLIFNFVLPFLLLMTRDAKRYTSMLKMVCAIVLVGHWFDFYNMVTPGVMQEHGAIGLLEVGLTLIYLAAFVFVTLSALSKIPLIAKRHPMMEESLHHHT